jgi:raffinose/stachyose/melibiose transport system substrate-binding protein
MKMTSLLAKASVLAAVVALQGPAWADPVELKFMDRLVTPEKTVHSKWLADTFNQKYAGKIHVTWEGVPDEVYKSKIFTVLRTPDAPDVFFSWEGGRAKFMVDSGYSAPLDAYYSKYGWDKTLSYAGNSLAVIEGKKYFVPTMMSASIVWYKPDIFDKFGIAVPKTWDELLAAAKKLKANGVTPFMLANKLRWPAQFMWSGIFVNKNGVDAYNQLVARQIPWTDPRVVDAFAQMKKLMDDGLFEEGANGNGVTEAVVPFSKGEVAMWYQGTFNISRFVNEKGVPNFPLGFFPLPKIGDREPTMSMFAEDTLMMNAKSDKKDAAAEFLNFVVSKEAQENQVAARQLYPANIEVDLSGLPPLLSDIGKVINQYKQSTFMHVDHAIADNIADPYLDALQAVLVGTKTPEEAAADVEKVAVSVAGPVKP